MSDDLNKIVPEDVNPVQEQSAAAGEAPVNDKLNEIADKLKVVAGQVIDKAQDTIDDLKDAAQDFAKDAKAFVNDVKEQIAAVDAAEEAKPASDEAPAAEEVPAAEEEPEEKDIDFSDKSLKELVDSLKEYVDSSDIRKLNKYAEVIKACFYKTLKKEKVSTGFDDVAEEAVKASFTDAPAEEPAAEAAAEAPAEEAATNPFAEIERGFKALYGKYRVMRAEFMSEQNAKREENYEAKSKILQELKSLVEDPGDLSAAYPRFRELQNSWRAIGAVPPAKAKDLYDSYYHNVELFYDFVKIISWIFFVC